MKARIGGRAGGGGGGSGISACGSVNVVSASVVLPLPAGVELYEFRWEGARKSYAETPPITGGFVGLHRKLIVLDRTQFFVGSLNLTPRAVKINMENGAFVWEAPGLAEEIARTIEIDMLPENAWRVHLGENGELYWENADERVTKQPARSGGQRFVDWFFTLLPLEGQI